MEEIYVIELHECSRLDSFVKFIGYTKDMLVAESIESQYNEDEDCEFCIIVTKIKEFR